MDEQYVLCVANEIRDQLVGLTPTNWLLSWGIEELTATVFKGMPSLKMKVKGRLWAHYVIIALDEGVDYYEIWLVGGKEKPKRIAYDVEFTQLGEIIDRAIESGRNKAEYEDFCEQERIKLMGA
ncbi:MAG: hypothetical protein LIP03_14090 [Bacteroidales bacterium]|nr:hypothetical protein [Bacteroidales bacterium]